MMVGIIVAVSGCATSGRTGRDVATEAPTDGVGEQLAFQDREPNPDGRSADGSSATVGGEPNAVIVGHVNTTSIVAHERPDENSPVVAELTNPTPIGGPLAFQLVETEVPVGTWAEVLLPVRPNGSTGWVRLDHLDLSSNPYRIEIDRADHRLAVYRDGLPWLTTEVAIGTGATPTPVGRFYIIELLKPPTPNGVYGPFAFGLSGFSETLTSYAGGNGVIGIHGTDEPEAIGTDVSHGCIRVENTIITRLAGVIPLGTPVVIS